MENAKITFHYIQKFWKKNSACTKDYTYVANSPKCTQYLHDSFPVGWLLVNDPIFHIGTNLLRIIF